MKALVVSGLLFIAAAARAAEFEDPVRLKEGGRVRPRRKPRLRRPLLGRHRRRRQEGPARRPVQQGQDPRLQEPGRRRSSRAGDWLQAEGKVAEVPGVW